ncbi:MAG: PepSY domain-containing protein [Pseudomonadota bacterium]
MKHFVLFCALLLPAIAVAEPWTSPAQRHQSESGRQPQTRITMGDAMSRVQQAFGGRVIQAQPASVNGHEGYRIKILTSRGEVRVVHVDAETGAMQ